MINKNINNPTFNKLLEYAKEYKHLIPMNEDNGVTSAPPPGKTPAALPTQGNQQPVPGKSAQQTSNSPQTASTTEKKPADNTKPEQKKEESPQKENKPQEPQSDTKDYPTVAKTVASNLLTLLSSYHVNSPAVSSNTITGLKELEKTTNMGAFVKNIISGLDAITNIINASPDAKYYGDFIAAKDQALKSYQDALAVFPDFDKIEVPDLGAFIKPQVDALTGNINSMAEDHPKEEPKPSTSKNVSFGNFVNFKTYESMIKEQLEEDDNESLDQLKADLQKAEDKKKAGKTKSVAKIKKRIFKELIAGCNDIMGRVNAVRNKITIASANPTQANFQSFKMEKKFVSIATDIKTMRDSLKTQDPESIESINRLITRYETSLKNFVDLELQFRDQYNNELDGLQNNTEAKRDQPDAYNAILQGNTAKQTLDNYSIANRKAVDNEGGGNTADNGSIATASAATPSPASGEENNQPKEVNKNKTEDKGANTANKKPDNKPSGSAAQGLKLKAPIKPGLRKGANGKNISDPTVAEFQKLVLNKFQNTNAYKKSPIFQKFKQYGADGFFGKTTGAIVGYLKGGFNLDTGNADITQELIDKIQAYQPAPIKESIVFRFNNFYLFEQFDEARAELILNQYETGAAYSGKPKGNSKEKGKGVKVENPTNISKEANLPKVANDEISKIKNDTISGYKVNDLIDELVKMGAVKNDDYGKDGAKCIASGKSVKFYENGAAMRIFDKELGIFDIKAGVCKWNDGSQDKIADLINKDGLPSKYGNTLSKLIADIYGTNKRDKSLYNDLLKWTPQQIKLLSMAYSVANSPYWTSGKKHNLDKDLGDEMTNTDEIRAFQKKFSSVL